MREEPITRRTILRVGAVGLTGGLAGCNDTNGGGEQEEPRETATEEPSQTPTNQPKQTSTETTDVTSAGTLSSLPFDVLLTFNDGIRDMSGNDRSVSVTGGELVDGRTGQALRLVPPDEYFTVETGLESPGFDSGGEAAPFSYEAWLQIHSEQQHEVFTNEGSRRRLAINADREVCGRMWGADGQAEGSPECAATVPLDEWFHIGFVFTGSEGQVYYNGELVATSPWNGYTGSAKTCSGSRAEGGGDCEAAPGRIDATIDRWSIVSTAVSPETMTDLATTPAGTSIGS